MMWEHVHYKTLKSKKEVHIRRVARQQAKGGNAG